MNCDFARKIFREIVEATRDQRVVVYNNDEIRQAKQHVLGGRGLRGCIRCMHELDKTGMDYYI